MSAENRNAPPSTKKVSKTSLAELLDFGPEPEASTSHPHNKEIAQRIVRLVEQIKDINRRMDALSSKLI